MDRNIFRARPDISAGAAIRKLGSMGVVRAMPMLRLAIEQGQLEWAPLAARALRQLGDTITAGDMLAWLSSSCSPRRLRAVLALPALVDRDALLHLLSALGDGDAAVRAAAARELGHLEYGSAIPVLTDALQSKSEVEEVRERSAVRWLSWPEVPGVSLRRPKHDELLRGLEGLVLPSAPPSGDSALPSCRRKRAAPCRRAFWRIQRGSRNDPWANHRGYQNARQVIHADQMYIYQPNRLR